MLIPLDGESAMGYIPIALEMQLLSVQGLGKVGLRKDHPHRCRGEMLSLDLKS